MRNKIILLSTCGVVLLSILIVIIIVSVNPKSKDSQLDQDSKPVPTDDFTKPSPVAEPQVDIDHGTLGTTFDHQVFDYFNEVRQNPQILLPILETKKNEFTGTNPLYMYKDGVPYAMSNEGKPVYEETIAFIKALAPLDPVEWSDELYEAANFHTNDIGPKGMRGHDSSDGTKFYTRILNYAPDCAMLGENISFGSQNYGVDPKNVIL